MKRTWLYAIGGMMIVVATFFYIQHYLTEMNAVGDDVTGEMVELSNPQVAPSFTLPNLAGEEVSLAALKGRIVIVNFWATWCAPCKAEMPELQRYYKQYSKQHDVEIIAINMTYRHDNDERVRAFKEAYNVSFPIVMEYEKSVSEAFQVLTIPSTFFIDREGFIRSYVKGPLQTAHIAQYVEALRK